MTLLQKIIIGVNLLFLMFYSYEVFKPQIYNGESAISHGVMMILHLFALFFAGVITHIFKREDIAKAFWLSMGVVLLIGFGTCVIYG
jgi:hypothetical protein